TDGFPPALLAFFEGMLEVTLDHAGVLELLQVPGKDGAEELPLPEDAEEPLAFVDDGQRGQRGIKERAGRVGDGVRDAEDRRLAQEWIGDGARAHHRYLTAI